MPQSAISNIHRWCLLLEMAGGWQSWEKVSSLGGNGFSIRHGLVWGSDIKPGLEMPRARYVGGCTLKNALRMMRICVRARKTIHFNASEGNACDRRAFKNLVYAGLCVRGREWRRKCFPPLILLPSLCGLCVRKKRGEILLTKCPAANFFFFGTP